ncbi:MAG TPA: hypothetical protein VMW72_06010 [Sedimentisphaerales bacterium]|nr:hypothetical protein [Sedimentisphaerales bacterium]
MGSRKHTGYDRGPHGTRYRAIPRPHKSIEYRSKVDACPETCQELIHALINPKRRQEWQKIIGAVIGQAKQTKGKRYLYIFTSDISRLTNDRDLLCTILGFCHDEISEVAEKVISDEIREIYPAAYMPLRNFASNLPTFQFEILVMHAEAKGLLPKTNVQDEDPKDLITLAVAIEEFHVSRTKLKRDIKSGNIKSYRKSKRGMHIVSRAEIAQNCTQKKS